MKPIAIFLSHRWGYGEHRDGLHQLLRPWVKDVDFFDLSVPQAHPIHVYGNQPLARELVSRIKQADVFLAIAGMYANHSDWMKREIDWAFALDRYIIPVIPHQQQRTASTATDFGSCEPVHWRSESLRNAILSGIRQQRTATDGRVPQGATLLSGALPRKRQGLLGDY
jgi:MTH538 TIR-like domain (DUF1863)